MFIDRIRLHDVRGFETLDFSLDRGGGRYAGWTVFTGDNGSGKSTLLKAIAIGLIGPDNARALQPSFHRWIREGAHEASIELGLVRADTDDFFVTQGNKKDRFPARLTLDNGGKETVLQADTKKFKTPERSIWTLDSKGWFSCGYGPFRRVFGASPEATRHMVAPATERFVTMFQEAASLAEVDQWLRHLSHKKLEGKTEEARQLDCLVEVLNDELMPNQISIDRVDSDGLWLKDRNGIRLAWSEMSDGYRAALALLADILRHMSKTFGVDGLMDRDSDGRPFVKRSGVVLIDEIDAHLHPEWQREIGFWLKRHFPNVQFLVTTHSPVICQAADPNGLFVLPEPGSSDRPRALTEDEYKQVIASRPDTILLSAAFGLEATRSPRAVEARRRYSALASKKRSGVALSGEEAREMKQVEALAQSGEEP